MFAGEARNVHGILVLNDILHGRAIAMTAVA